MILQFLRRIFDLGRSEPLADYRPTPEHNRPDAPPIHSAGVNVHVHLIHPDPPEPLTEEERTGKPMKLSKDGLKLLAEWEGVELRVYKDVGGKDTIGVGHLITTPGYVTIAGEKVPVSDGITREQAFALLAEDVVEFEMCVNANIEVLLSQHQFDALVIFAFNVGCGAFESSTLRKLLNQGKYEEVPGQLARWNKVNGQVSQGLVNRRNKEIKLWNGLL